MKKLTLIGTILAMICISSMSVFAGSYCEDNNIKNPTQIYEEKSKSYAIPEGPSYCEQNGINNPSAYYEAKVGSYTNDESRNPYNHK